MTLMFSSTILYLFYGNSRLRTLWYFSCKYVLHRCKWLTCVQVYEDEKSVYLVMELMRGGELLDRIRNHRAFSEREASRVMHTVISTVAYLHQHGVSNFCCFECIEGWEILTQIHLLNHHHICSFNDFNHVCNAS